MSKNITKRWFGNMKMTSNCDFTNSAHQIQMTTYDPEGNPPPMKIFCVRHWMYISLVYVFLKSCTRIV